MLHHAQAGAQEERQGQTRWRSPSSGSCCGSSLPFPHSGSRTVSPCLSEARVGLHTSAPRCSPAFSLVPAVSDTPVATRLQAGCPGCALSSKYIGSPTVPVSLSSFRNTNGHTLHFTSPLPSLWMFPGRVLTQPTPGGEAVVVGESPPTGGSVPKESFHYLIPICQQLLGFFSPPLETQKKSQ